MLRGEKDHRGGRRWRGGDKRKQVEEMWKDKQCKKVREGLGERWRLGSSLGAVTARIRPRCDSLGRRNADKMDDKLQAAPGE